MRMIHQHLPASAITSGKRNLGSAGPSNSTTISQNLTLSSASSYCVLTLLPLLTYLISVGTVFFGAFAFGIGYDTVTTAWWDRHNKGVSCAACSGDSRLGEGFPYVEERVARAELRAGTEWHCDVLI